MFEALGEYVSVGVGGSAYVNVCVGVAVFVGLGVSVTVGELDTVGDTHGLVFPIGLLGVKSADPAGKIISREQRYMLPSMISRETWSFSLLMSSIYKRLGKLGERKKALKSVNWD